MKIELQPFILALFEAAKIGNLQLLMHALSRGAPADSRDTFNSTPLMAASFKGHLEMINALIEAGGDPNARDENGVTPFLHAAWGGQLGALKLLAKHGANPMDVDNIHSGATGLRLALVGKTLSVT